MSVLGIIPSLLHKYAFGGVRQEHLESSTPHAVLTRPRIFCSEQISGAVTITAAASDRSDINQYGSPPQRRHTALRIGGI
jgi:hypothetical protein